ncbi:hypothetical protein BGW37DRAFT_262698 [Umbelopsis sp. PMI_123]|nr:hypothetical protein BGW37DRAFT_262698 [Umbelopsis sp. PMI_123]
MQVSNILLLISEAFAISHAPSKRRLLQAIKRTLHYLHDGMKASTYKLGLLSLNINKVRKREEAPNGNSIKGDANGPGMRAGC